jgi:hypothetical protein
VFHRSFRYHYARDFERRWRGRLSTPQSPTGTSSRLHVAITHRFPNRTDTVRKSGLLADCQWRSSRFNSHPGKEASQAGRLALQQSSSEG